LFWYNKPKYGFGQGDSAGAGGAGTKKLEESAYGAPDWPFFLQQSVF